MEVDSVVKNFGERTILSDIYLCCRPGDIIGLFGRNGEGKSTLLKIIFGTLKADRSFVRINGQVQKRPAYLSGLIAYLPQHTEWAHPERTLLDTMLYEENCSTQRARDRLGIFHFRREDVFKRVSTLSGGELARLKLCMLMDESVNMLLLDEPTNHLDIMSREWIEEAVDDFSGTLLFVSHDRYFINRFAERILTLSNGAAEDFRGGFDAYRKHMAQAAKPTGTASQKMKKGKPVRRNAKNELKKLANIEREIEAAETRKAEVERELTETNDFERLQELLSLLDGIAAERDSLYELWGELSDSAEEI